MLKKMKKKLMPRIIMLCSCAVMICVNVFAWNFSSISLMVIAGVVSLVIYVVCGTPKQKGGAKR